MKTEIDRDVKRRARYRGNPERARFQRQPDSEQFTITTTDHCYSRTAHSPQELAQRLCHVSLADDDDCSSVMNLPPAERPLAATTPLPVDALPDEAPELESPNEEPLAHVEEPDEEPAGLTPPLPNEGKTAGTQRWRQQKQRQKPPIGNAVTYTATVDGLEGAPSRFTRSMARKIGGIQPPRRYFGEGVSESQILY